MTKLRVIWGHVVPVVLVLADWTQSLGMMLAAIGAWYAALKYMIPLLRDSSSLGFFGDILIFCIVAGPIIWGFRRFTQMLSADDAEDEDEVTEETTGG